MAKNWTNENSQISPVVGTNDGYLVSMCVHKFFMSIQLTKDLEISSKPGNDLERTWRSSFIPNPSFKIWGFPNISRINCWPCAAVQSFSSRNEKTSRRKTWLCVAIWSTAAFASWASKLGCHSTSIPTTLAYDRSLKNKNISGHTYCVR